ncbi:hypothetical protein J4401_03655 [Candidatus Woesearchaeota archaeon]|nr:hypothetical protein [Candidatus Woesearchaeota archaeon]
MTQGILSRFNKYQLERFPLAVLVFTTLSVVLSSSAIVLPRSQSIFSNWPAIIVGTVTGLLFTFLMRVFDDFKDKEFDDKFHGERPVQKSVISLKELNVLNIAGITVQITVNLIYSISAFLWWCLAMAYSLLARNEFFIKNWIKKHFHIYNLLNLMQLFFLQIYLYALISPVIVWSEPLLYAHFIFVLLNSGMLDMARKLKAGENESKGLDTYSSRWGMKKAALVLGFISAGILVVFTYISNALGGSIQLIAYGGIAFIILLSCLFVYLNWNDGRSSKIVQAGGVLFFLSVHILIALTRA